MLVVVVTTNSVEYPDFVKVKSLAEVCEIHGNIDYLIIHKSIEPSDKKAEYLTRVKDKVGLILYIRNREDADQTVKLIVTGSDGKYIDDEFFLESSDELHRLLESLDNVTDIIELGGYPVLSDFYNRYLKDGDADFSPAYLEVVKGAVETMMNDYKKKDLELVKLSTTGTELFSNTLSIVDNMSKDSINLQESFQKVSDALDRMKSSTPASSIQGALFFSEITYAKNKNIIPIKEIGSCKYLVSFMLGFRKYLEIVQYAKPKLIFLMPPGRQYQDMYGEYSYITIDTRNSDSIYDNVVFINCPNKDVVLKMLDDMNYNVFIVVDMLKTSGRHLIHCKKKPVYAVGSGSLVSRMKLRAVDCFTSVSPVPGGMFCVPTFSDYPEGEVQRVDLYCRECKAYYDLLGMLGR